MRLRLELVPAVLLLLSALAGAAAAAPVPADRGAFAPAMGGVGPASSGPCWWRKGERVCRAPATPGPTRYQPSDYYEHDANRLPFGTERWRDQMRRENRLGNPG